MKGEIGGIDEMSSHDRFCEFIYLFSILLSPMREARSGQLTVQLQLNNRYTIKIYLIVNASKM